MSKSPEKSAEAERRKDQIYVGQLSQSIREEDLREAFGEFGEIKDLILKSGFAFIVIYRRNLDFCQE